LIFIDAGRTNVLLLNTGTRNETQPICSLFVFIRPHTGQRCRGAFFKVGIREGGSGICSSGLRQYGSPGLVSRRNQAGLIEAGYKKTGEDARYPVIDGS
jgi:hypothetical protein